jgi:hypothetical protein
MQVATGTGVNGKIVVEGVSLTEGAIVAVVTRGADESFSLTEKQESELDAYELLTKVATAWSGS